MSTEIFTLSVSAPCNETIVYKTLVTDFDGGKEKRRGRWVSPKRMFNVALVNNSQTVMDSLWTFYNARKGIYDTFLFENPAESPKVGEVIGTGNGFNKYFYVDNPPIYSLATTTVYVAGVSVAFTANLTIGQIVCIVAPASGKIVTANYRTFRTVRFAEDGLTKELFAYKLLNAELKLVEVLP